MCKCFNGNKNNFIVKKKKKKKGNYARQTLNLYNNDPFT